MKSPQTPRWSPRSTPTFWINDASRALMRGFEARLRPLGFGTAYLPVALALEAHGPMQQKALLAHVRVEQPTLTALLARMERDGLIARRADATDARARIVSLTPRAKSSLARVKTSMQEVVEVALTGVSARDRERLTKTLRRVVANLSPGDDAEE